MEEQLSDQPKKKLYYYCSVEGCPSYFDRPYRLTQHLYAHNNIRPFPCTQPDCRKAYTSKSHLDRHIISVHKPPANDVMYSCPQCMKAFANRQNLKRHLNAVHKVAFTCEVCRMSFKKKNQLSTHMYEHTGIKAFKCDLCTDTFVSLYLKKRHMRYHKTYNCEECDISFNHWSKFQKHKKTDHGKKPLAHHLKSWKSLIESNVTVIQSKLRFPGGAELGGSSPSAEDDAEEYICNECKRTFKQRVHIVKHLKSHGQIIINQTFPCPYENCDRFYSRNSNLKQHILVKHMKIYHECTICNAQLSTKAKLNYHTQLHYRISGAVPKPVTERKPRKDEGSFKTSMALKLAGLSEVPEDHDIQESETQNDSEILEDGGSLNDSQKESNIKQEADSNPYSPINLSAQAEHIEIEVDVHV